MKLFFRILVPVGILLIAFLTVRWLMATRPTPMVRTPPPTVMAVDATRLKKTDYQVFVRTRGVVKPRTQSTLKPEVSGKVVSVAPNFREGGFFEEGDVLLEIDPSDYETALTVAKATLAQRESALELERAQHEQAKENWRLLGDGTDPNPLTLREPQLAEAIANVESAKARVEEAERDLARTKITAPYAGHVQSYSVDVGQYVSPGNDLATIFAVDYVEVRMPIDNRDIDYIQLPERYRGGQEQREPGTRVLLRGEYGSRNVTWEGRLVRADGVIDSGSRQLFVVAQVDDPYGQRAKDKPPLKVGQWVYAEIEGEKLEDVFVIPRSAVRKGDGDEVLIIDADSLIQRRPVSMVASDEENIIVREGLEEGEVLCLTPMRFAAEGVRVVATIDGVPPKPQGPPKGMGPPVGGRPGKPGMAKPAAAAETKS